VAARALAVVATAMYDAWSAFDPLAVPTQPGNGILRQTGSAGNAAAKAQAISFAAYRAQLDLFPSLAANAATLMTSLGYDPTDTSTDPTTPSGIGNLAAAAVIAFRHADGSNQLGTLTPTGMPYADYSGYTTPNTPYVVSDPNVWQPLAITINGVTTIQRYATPFWGAVTPFASLPAFNGTGPARYPSMQYQADAQTLLAYSAGLNDTTKMIAEYWADWPGTQLPPGHWTRFGEYVSRRDAHGLDADAQMFFALNNALLDAGVSAWAVKRTFNSVRPITAIHFLFSGTPVYAWAGPGKGTQWIDGGAWQPYQPASVITPPFAEYTSGHSTFSFAAAAVLQHFTGSDKFGFSTTLPAGSSNVEPGITPANPVTLSFPTFSAAASQAGLSRRYGGIHFIEGDLNGRVDGYAIGQGDWTRAVTYFNGGKPCTNGWGNGGGDHITWGGGWGGRGGGQTAQSSWCKSNNWGGWGRDGSPP
jgi:PAP2 superfamily